MVATKPVVRRSNLPAAGPSGSWHALVLDVERPGAAALRLEVTGRGHLLLRQGDAVALLAEIDDDHAGADYLTTGRFRSPVPPIRTAHATTLAEQRPDRSWYAGWAHHFATALISSTAGPLHSGRWVISPEVPRLRSPSWPHLLLPDDAGRIDWFAANGAWQVLPLRRLASSDDGRVRSYRKQARDGTLPPVLLWWVSGLDCYLILDGHDRLVAAIAENRQPPLLGLSLVRRQQAASDTEAAIIRYTTTVAALERTIDAQTPGATAAFAAVNRQFAWSLSAIETWYGPTRAWPLPGGTAAWQRLARAAEAERGSPLPEIQDGTGCA